MMLKTLRTALVVAAVGAAALSNGQRITVNLRHATLKQAMETLLAGSEDKFKIDGKLDAAITLMAKDTDVEEALYQTMLQAGAIYDHENHVYAVRAMHSGDSKTNGSLQTILARVDYTNADFRLATQEILGLAGVKYKLAPELRGIVTLYLRNVSADLAIQNVFKEVNARYLPWGNGIDVMSSEEYDRRTTGTPPPLP